MGRSVKKTLFQGTNPLRLVVKLPNFAPLECKVVQQKGSRKYRVEHNSIFYNVFIVDKFDHNELNDFESIMYATDINGTTYTVVKMTQNLLTLKTVDGFNVRAQWIKSNTNTNGFGISQNNIVASGVLIAESNIVENQIVFHSGSTQHNFGPNEINTQWNTNDSALWQVVQDGSEVLIQLI